MKNISDHDLEKLLSKKKIKEVATGLGLSYDGLMYHIKAKGIDVRQLKEDRAKKVILSYSKKLTISEMVKASGFSRGKIIKLLKKHNVLTKMCNRTE